MFLFSLLHIFMARKCDKKMTKRRHSGRTQPLFQISNVTSVLVDDCWKSQGDSIITWGRILRFWKVAQSASWGCHLYLQPSLHSDCSTIYENVFTADLTGGGGGKVSGAGHIEVSICGHCHRVAPSQTSSSHAAVRKGASLIQELSLNCTGAPDWVPLTEVIRSSHAGSGSAWGLCYMSSPVFLPITSCISPQTSVT